MIDDLDGFVARTLQKINDGVAAARTAGIQAELPEFVEFQAIVIGRWQSKPIEGGESGVTEETQGGTTTEKGGSVTKRSGLDKDKTTQVNDNAHRQRTQEVTDTTVNQDRG